MLAYQEAGGPFRVPGGIDGLRRLVAEGNGVAVVQYRLRGAGNAVHVVGVNRHRCADGPGNLVKAVKVVLVLVGNQDGLYLDVAYLVDQFFGFGGSINITIPSLVSGHTTM